MFPATFNVKAYDTNCTLMLVLKKQQLVAPIWNPLEHVFVA